MRSISTRLIPLLLIALGWNLALAVSYAVHLPIVFGQASPSLVTLVQSDSTFVSVARDEHTGRIFVNYIDRAHQNRLHATELITDVLHELPVPLLATASLAAAPAFTPPDSAKDAASAVLIIDGWEWLFVTSRDADDPTGPFKLKLLRFKP